MNVNLHIDSIVLDGLDLVPGQSQLLQQAVASELTNMFTRQGIGSSLFTDPNNRTNLAGNSVRVGHTTDAMSLGLQLANAIYANIPQSLSPIAAIGGQS